MSFSQFKRFKDIIAFQNPEKKSDIIAFHTNNLELASISPEAYSEMSDINVLSGALPKLNAPVDHEAHEQLENWNSEISTETRIGKIDFEIRSVTINVTQICNLKCTYCAAGGDGTYGDPVTRISVEKTLPQLKFFIDKLKPGRKFNMSFVGGEPLLYPEGLFAICEYVESLTTEKNFTPIFSLVTNGTLITEKMIPLFKKYNIHITVSFDGSSNVNDQLRPTKTGLPSTQMTLDGVSLLNKNRGSIGSLGFSCVLNETFQNLVETYHFFNSFNPDWMEFTLAYSQAKPELQQIYINSLNEIAKAAWDRGREEELRKVKTFDHYFSLLDSQQKIENHCGAGKSYLMIDSKNQLYTCPWDVNKPSELVGKGSDLNHQNLEKYSKPLIILNNCQTCWARYLCGGGCMYIHKEHTGDKHKKDTLFCERTRSLILTALLYYKLSREGS